jgi:hypothetical protein
MLLIQLEDCYRSRDILRSRVFSKMLITVAARFEAWTVFVRFDAGIVGSNPIQGMDVCVHLFCVCVVLYVGNCLATGWSPVQRVLPTVYRIKKLKNG